MKHKCPVCLTYSLAEPYHPRSFDVCRMCGVEYGNDDFGISHEELREAWLAAGQPNWWEETEREDFEGGVSWLKDFFSIPENEERRETAWSRFWEKARRVK